MLVSTLGENRLTLGVTELAESGSGHVERNVDLGAQHRGRVVYLLNVDQDPWAEPDLVEGIVVFTHRLETAQLVNGLRTIAVGGADVGCTYNLIIRTTRIVGPRGLLHDSPGHSLKVEQVVALRQTGL